jgi:DNA replication and repair protein RecF
MALDRITLGHFRNHAASRLDGAAHLNLLVGENGAGKTNVLEALSLLAPGRGLRRAALDEMAASRGPGTFAVSAALDCADGRAPVAASVTSSSSRCGPVSVRCAARSRGRWRASSAASASPASGPPGT